MLVSETGELVGTTRAVGIGQRLVRSDGKRRDLEVLRLLRPGWIEKCQQRERTRPKKSPHGALAKPPLRAFI